jgi:hypothetical protein
VLVIAVIAALGAVGLLVRGWVRRYDALGRRRRYPWISAALLGVLAVGFAVPTILRHREEAKLSAVATVLVGQRATVHCETFGETFTDLSGDLGFVQFGPDGVPEHHTTIMRGPCGDLRSYYDGDQAHPSADEVIAVHVLTHESMHMRGQPVEADAECEAMQRDAETAQLLGATPAEGLSLAEAYWREDYPLMPATYRSSDCAPGGSLDEHLPDAPWSPPGTVAVPLPATS